MPPSGFTVTEAVALAILAAVAVTVAEPTATPVTCTAVLVAPAAKLKVAGTVAMDVLSEFRLTVNPPAGAFPLVRFSVRFPCAPELSVRLPANCMTGAGTFTVPTPEV